MFGVTWRTVGTALFSAFSTAVVLRVLSPIVEQMGHESHWLVQSYTALASNMLLIAALSAVVMWLVGSISGVGVGGGQLKRITYAHFVTLGTSLGALMYFRFGLVLIELGTGQHSGPFSSVASLLEVVVPVSLAIVLGSTWLWVLISPWQRERRRREQQQRVVRGPR